jgi:predicted nuclease of predicted toxin-antitoxin system
MKFLLDESADFPLAGHLAGLGQDVTSIIRDYQRGIPDEEVLAIARREHRILITNDKDFGELIYRRRILHAGVILFRLDDEALATKIARLDAVLRDHADDLASRRFVVVDDQRIRVRR